MTEFKTNPSLQLYTGNALPFQGDIEVKDYNCVPVKFESKSSFLEEALRSSRFNASMAPGAWNIDSSEFNTTVLADYGPKTSAAAELEFWSGISAATKTAIAALTPGAGQGAITAATQAKVAAMTANSTGFDGVLATILYNDNFKAAGLGNYIKVTGVASITAANIAAEYAKLYQAIVPAVLDDNLDPAVIYAPRSHRQLMRTANNSVGAAQQINFLFESTDNQSKVFYNGVEVLFVPLPEGYMYASQRSNVTWNTDLDADLNVVQIDKVQADADVKFIRMIFTMDATIMRQSQSVLYGG